MGAVVEESTNVAETDKIPVAATQISEATADQQEEEMEGHKQDLSKLTKKELEKFCTVNGLPTKGNKKDLIAAIEAAAKEPESDESVDEKNEEADPSEIVEEVTNDTEVAKEVACSKDIEMEDVS